MTRRNGCPHDPAGLLKSCSLCDGPAADYFDDNKAYFETAAWLKYKSGEAEHSTEAELRVLNEMYAMPDERTEL